MKYILRIDYQHYALPENANVNTLLKLLSDARAVDHHYTQSGDFYVLKGQPEVVITAVPSDRVVDRNKRKAIPETTGGPY